MASKKVPDEIKKHRPGPCTEVKCINGRFYVYMYSAVRLNSGRWGRKTGKNIGAIIPGTGFVPNTNYPYYTGGLTEKDEITIVEYGQYALVETIAQTILRQLRAHFPEERARQIFSYATILYVNDFVHLDQVQTFYEQSWMSVECSYYSFKMGKTALNGLLQDLGMRTTRVTAYENSLIEASSSKIAIDGHAIRSCSNENDLAEAGCKFNILKEDQVNLLMGYDIERGMPLFARMFRGSCNDKTTIADFENLLSFRKILFVVDRGFYSEDNLRLLSANENTYIIPVPSNTKIFKEAMQNSGYSGDFCYRASTRHSRVEYREIQAVDEEGKAISVFVFRDVEENEKCRFNYLHNLELGKDGYSQKGYEANMDLFGVYVLRTNGKLTPCEVFSTYKKRWGIETFYQYVRNCGDFNNLMVQDYYKEQGMAFIMLIAGQIHQTMIEAVKRLGCNTISTKDILLMARRLKMERRRGFWILKNTRAKELGILEKIGFVPLKSCAVKDSN